MKRFIGIFIALIMLTLICCSTSSITPVVIETPNNDVNTEKTIEEPRDSVKLSRKKKVQYNLSGYSTKIVDIREIEINGHLYIVGTAFGGASDGGSSIVIIHSESCPCKR